MKLTNEIVINKAKAIGFDLVGFARAEKLKDETEKLKVWLSRQYQAGMKYMERNAGKREDVKIIFPDAKSVISLAVNYYTPEKHQDEKNRGKISRYAWGTDYHFVMWDMLAELESVLKNIDPEFDSVSYVDTGPVMDKAWAVKSGLGWLGKHTNVINKEFGSWIFLSTIISNYEFDYPEEIPDFCGSCTACIDACPTDAIVDQYIVDSAKCISYLTIENKDSIPAEFKGKFENWLFGCDICQDVCPWNIKFAQLSGNRDFYPIERQTGLDLMDILNMEKEEFNKKFERSPLKRGKLKGLKRNAKFLQDSEKS